ncbi:MAG: DUF2207 domain-containing protein [Atopobiaceae bacterium]|nr:DUF2207 domain-containing protein [Atopobiaceae bacterium]
MASRRIDVCGSHAHKFMMAVVATLTALAIMPHVAFAREYSREQVDIDATVGTDGGVTVKEARQFDFDGSFHGVYWKIPTGTYEGRSIETSVLSVGEIVGGQFVEFEQSDTGAEHTYELSKYSSYVQVKLYSSHEDDVAQFVISYHDTNLATRYDDTSELYWKFVSDGWDVQSQDVTCTVHLPVPSGQEVLAGDNVRAWGHGPLDATVSFDNGDVVYQVPGVGSSEFAEARIAFPADWLSDAQSVGTSRLSTILSEEQQWADEANARRARARVMMIVAQLVGGGVPLASLVLGLLTFLRYKASHRPQFDDKYFRDVPSDDHPAVLGALLNDGSVTDECMTAALMRLTDLGYTKLELVKLKEKGLFGREKIKEDYCLTPMKWPSDSGDDNKERVDYATMKFLFSRVVPLAARYSDDRDALYFSSLEKVADSHPERYDSYLKSWNGSVNSECLRRGFFSEDRPTGRALLIGIGTIDIIVAAICLVAMILFDAPILSTIFLPLLGIFLGVGLIFLGVYLKPRSQEAIELKAQLKALRRWLKDFTRLEEAIPQDVVLWNRLLVMAVVLGVSEEVISQLKMAAPQLLQSSAMASTYGWFYGGGPSMPMRSFSDAASKAHSVSTAALASSSDSSGGGGGGGFSGGGGGGFGGGGGGGAF